MLVVKMIINIVDFISCVIAIKTRY